MTTTAHSTVEAAEKSQQQIFLNVDRSGLLQRKCDCGKTADITGACSDCQSLQTKTQPGSVRQSATAPVLHELIQPKLTIGAPNDRYEQEADRVADQVMRMPESFVQRQIEPEKDEEEGMVQRKAIASQITPLVQRQGLPEIEEEEESVIQTKVIDNQAAPSVSTQNSSEISPIVHEVLNSPGQPLAPDTRHFMESRFGYDFSQVRVHADAKAAQVNRELNAQAFTYRQDVFFGAGKYSPESREGQRLLAHELTHVVQQSDNHFMRNEVISKRATKDPVSFTTTSPEKHQKEIPSNLNGEYRDRPIPITNVGTRVQRDSEPTAKVTILEVSRLPKPRLS